jgi:hypothetical protein
MQAVVSSEMAFAPGCEPTKLLAGLDVSAKAIERAAEAIGNQIAERDQQEIGRAKQLVLPVVSKQNIPKMYVLMDGVQVPVVGRRNRGPGRQDRSTARPHARVQVRLRVHANHCRPGRLAHPQSGLHHLRRSHRNCQTVQLFRI